MIDKKVLLVKYGEIALRKGNRALFEHRLMDTIRERLWDYGGDAIHVLREQGRIVVEDMRGDIDMTAVLPRIRSIFGITAFCLCKKTDENAIDHLKDICLAFIRDMHGSTPLMDSTAGSPFSFKVETKRGDKRYPLPSRTVSAEVGGFILDHCPHLRVDVHKPDVTLWIEIRKFTYIYTESMAGEGGLPYGSSGKGVLLLSGGIDSPVAGYLMARRGVEIVPVYFHSPPHTSERVVDKVTDLSKRLCRYTGSLRLFIVPFTDVQLFLHKQVKPEKLTLFLKRAMLAIASTIAAKEQAHCLITGDSVGQVASQTIHSLEAVHKTAAYPVLRPLSAMDKQEIIRVAQSIDTYDISIRPYEDCCTLFVAEHPESRPKASALNAIEARLHELPALLSEAADKAEVREIHAT